MPRRPRLELPGVPMHVTHRGVNRAAVFLDDWDFRDYRRHLRDVSLQHGIALHAYALMSNHVHLLVTASTPGALSRAMSRLGVSYVPAFNRRHGRTGTLWEGRFKSCLVDSERYLLMVYRYIELNPVRASMVERPEDYPWSSARANLGLEADPWIERHPVLAALSDSDAETAFAYRGWLDQGMDEHDLAAIRQHIRQERALGNARFQAMVAKTLDRPAVCRARGRPRLATSAPDSAECDKR